MENIDDFILNEPSSCVAEPEEELNGPRHLTGSQALALRHLSDLYLLHRQPERAGIKVKTRPLCVGPSGAGKTSLVRRFAETHGMKALLIVNGGAWIPNGSASSPQTLSVVKQFVAKHETGVILIDEIDKICPHSQEAFSHAWNLGVFTELASMLDCDSKLETNGWTTEDINRLKRHFIIGCGTWQAILNAPSKGKKSIKESEYTDKLTSKFGIPEEVVFRFAHKLLEIRPPGVCDFKLAIRRVRADLKLPALSEDGETRLAEEFVAARHGMRTVEEYLATLLIRHPEAREKLSPPADRPPSNKIRMSQRELNKRIEEAELLALNSQHPVLDLQSRLQHMLELAKAATDKKDHFEPAQLKKIIELLKKFSAGLDYGAAISQDERCARETMIVEAGRELTVICDLWLEGRPFGLEKCGALDSMIKAQVMVRRILATWRFLPTIEVTDAAG